MRMVSQVRGDESVRRVMQESTVTIEEVEDEVVNSRRDRYVQQLRTRLKRKNGQRSEEETEDESRHV